jgi:hypothetical protein
MAKEQGVDNVLAAYICGENTVDPENGVIMNINIYNESANYGTLNASDYTKFEEEYLTNMFVILIVPELIIELLPIWA